jgi:hypothetical protein
MKEKILEIKKVQEMCLEKGKQKCTYSDTG